MKIKEFLSIFFIVINLCILKTCAFSLAVTSKHVNTKESEKFAPVPNLGLTIFSV